MASFSIPAPGEPVKLGDFLLADTRFPAVYFLFSRGDVVYVGQSRTLRQRIEQHLSDRTKEFDSVAYLRCHWNQLSEIENHYIRELSPKYNACGLSKKVREREVWRRDKSLRSARQQADSVWVDPRDIDPSTIETVDAAEVFLNAAQTADFMGVTDGDADRLFPEHLREGANVIELLYFAAGNKTLHEAQQRFDDL